MLFAWCPACFTLPGWTAGAETMTVAADCSRIDTKIYGNTNAVIVQMRGSALILEDKDVTSEGNDSWEPSLVPPGHSGSLPVREARPFARRMTVRGALMPVLLAVLAACSSNVERVSEPDTLAGLAFLQPGVTTRKEVEARLGAPRQVYEPDRVTTYWLTGGRGGYETADSPVLGYNLVLHFRPDRVLDRWSLVSK